MSESAPTNVQGESGRSDALFLASSQPRPDFGSVLLFAITVLLVFGGLFLMSLAFGGGIGAAGFWLFGGSLLLTVLGLWLAFGLIPNRR